MGKHGKKVQCGMCSGTGKIKTGGNGSGQKQEVQCTGCAGSGKQG
ncbi:hypothetical protein [Actinomadura craniellae]|nr:hypothetical protein [Actinomadura craniellae]